MFKENKKLVGTDTLIGQGTTIEGSIQTEANIRVEGVFKGSIISSGDIIIGEYGIAESEIQCSNMTIAGKVVGDISVTGRLIVTPSGHLQGNAIVKSIIIHEGGTLNGQCQMMDKGEEINQNKRFEKVKEKADKQKVEADEDRKKSEQAG